MHDVIQQMSEMALLFSRASNSLSTLGAIQEVMEEYEAGDMDAQETLDEIASILEEMQVLESMTDMSPEELSEMLDDADQNLLGGKSKGLEG
jgi:ABC-type dipeptide/oligopeptide/nickel transport system ATPase subunit